MNPYRNSCPFRGTESLKIITGLIFPPNQRFSVAIHCLIPSLLDVYMLPALVYFEFPILTVIITFNSRKYVLWRNYFLLLLFYMKLWTRESCWLFRIGNSQRQESNLNPLCLRFFLKHQKSSCSQTLEFLPLILHMAVGTIHLKLNKLIS